MKKALILAYDFPPYISVGAQRPYSWFLHLKEFGIEPIVITRQWTSINGNNLDYIAPGNSPEVIEEVNENGVIYGTPYYPNLSNKLLLKYGEKRFKYIRKIISGFYEFAQFFWLTGPKKEIYKFANDYLKENSVDVIIATGDPFILFSYASKLSAKFSIPWIADYRDTWSQSKLRSSNCILKKLHTILEKKNLRNVTYITTVSSFIVNQLKQNLPDKNFEIITNGFNSSEIKDINTITQSSEKLTISFAGTIYKWHPIESFLSTCNRMLSNGKLNNLNLDFYGTQFSEQQLNKFSEDYIHLNQLINIHPKINSIELNKKLASANIFLLFNDYSILGTKIFTYIGIKRKILFLYSDDEKALELKKKHYTLEEFSFESKKLQEELINSTKSGIVVRNDLHLEEVLSELHDEFVSNKFISCNSQLTDLYTREKQVEKLASLISCKIFPQFLE